MSTDVKLMTPTAIATASRCLHTWYLEVLGDPALKSTPDAGTLLMFERGKAEEKRRVGSLTGVAKPAWDERDWQAGHAATVALLRAGHHWIYQGVLVSDDMRGQPDLLRRVEGASNLGDYSYEPVDVKGHQSVEKRDRIQLLGYARLLEPVLGFRPTRGAIWLNTGTIQDVDLVKDAADFDSLLADMQRIQDGALVTQGFRCGECDRCLWVDHCAAEWKRVDQVSLLYRVTGDTARDLWNAGFKSWRDVAAADPAALAAGAIRPDKAKDIWLQAQAWKTGKPQLRRPVTFPAGVPIYFYDIETFGQVVYLHGVIRVHGQDREERQFLARNPSGEETAWREFLDYLARDDRALVYDWADYERGFVQSLWRRFRGNAAGWRHLDTCLVDQRAFVRDHFALPLSGYGIKKVAPLFGFAWSAADAGGLNSEAWYQEWLATGNEEILAKIQRYNLDDVVAMEVIDRALRDYAQQAAH